MDMAIIFDCEFLAIEGVQQRFWCGPYDPDPVIAQIGAVKLGLTDGFDILDTRRLYIRPVDRHGQAYVLDPFFTQLTGITPEKLGDEGQTLADALADLDRFSKGAPFWSWGKDELNMIAISCYVSDIQPVIPARRFGNLSRLMLKAGMPYSDIQKTRSDRLADYFGVSHPPLASHDALDDALSAAYAAQYLLKSGQLSGVDFMSD